MLNFRPVLMACIGLALATPGFAQTPNSDAPTLQQILAEIKAIHEDMRVTESTQILLAAMQMQQGVVNRATENADSARSRLQDVERNQRVLTSLIATAQDQFDQATDDNEKKRYADELDRHKSNLAALKVEEQSRTSNLQQMEERLRTAQDSLDTIQNELNAIVARINAANK